MNRLLSGAFWSLAGNILVRFFGFFSLAALARILSAADFGRYALLSSWLQSAQSMTGLGVDTAMQRELPRQIAQGKTVDVSTIWSALFWPLLITLVGACCVLMGAEYVAQHWLGSAELAPAVRIACVGLVVYPVTIVVIGLYSSFQEYRDLAKANLAAAGALAFCALIGGLLFGYKGAVAAAAFAGATQIWFLLRHGIVRHRAERFSFKVVVRQSNAFLRLGLPYFLGNTLAGALSGLCATMVIARYVPIDEVGVLRIGQSLISVLLLAPTALTGVVLPSASRIFIQQGDLYNLIRPFHIKLMFGLGCAAALLAIPFIPEWLAIFHYGGAPARKTVGLLLLNLPLLSANPAITTYLVAEGATVLIAIGSTLGSALVLALSFLLIPANGLNGYCLASIAGYVLGAVLLLRWSGWRWRWVSRASLGLLTLSAILFGALVLDTLSEKLLWRTGGALGFTFLAVATSWFLFFAPEERALVKNAGGSFRETFRRKTAFPIFRNAPAES